MCLFSNRSHLCIATNEIALCLPKSAKAGFWVKIKDFEIKKSCRFVSLLYRTNRFHVTVHRFTNRSQIMSKCGKKKKSGIIILNDLDWESTITLFAKL